jgi:hypothetical protein
LRGAKIGLKFSKQAHAGPTVKSDVVQSEIEADKFFENPRSPLFTGVSLTLTARAINVKFIMALAAYVKSALTPRREGGDGRWSRFGKLGISTNEIFFSYFRSADGEHFARFRAGH